MCTAEVQNESSSDGGVASFPGHTGNEAKRFYSAKGFHVVLLFEQFLSCIVAVQLVQGPSLESGSRSILQLQQKQHWTCSYAARSSTGPALTWPEAALDLLIRGQKQHWTCSYVARSSTGPALTWPEAALDLLIRDSTGEKSMRDCN